MEHLTYCMFLLLLTVVSLPVMITQPKPTTVHVYDTATFQCTGRSYGKVTITWKRLMSKLPVTATVNVTKISSNEVTSILIIKNIIGYYSGNYYCVIENDVGKVNSKFAYCDVTGIVVNYSISHCVLLFAI